MRGVPPLLGCGLAMVVFGESLSPAAWTAIGVLVAGVLLLGWDGMRRGALRGNTARFVLLQIGIISAYTLIDASGVRASGNALAYIAWMFVLTAAAMAIAARESFGKLMQEGPRAFAI